MQFILTIFHIVNTKYVWYNIKVIEGIAQQVRALA